ncbi:MAG: ferrochelatase [Polyangiaceae bacterium]|nr:ferrochelatase [Polyangiaceae bacterium]
MADGVLLTAHGTVETLEELPDFLARIRRGRPASPALIEEVTRRYRVIGGSPLQETTLAVARRLEAALGVPVAVGMRLSRPGIADAVAELRSRGVTRALSLPLAPQSVHVYHAAVRQAAGGLALVEAPSWGGEPAFLQALSSKIDDALAELAPERRGEAALLLTAHSLPMSAVAAGDPYEEQLRAMCDGLVATRAERRRVVVGFQSQGMDGGAWLGPDVSACLTELARAGVRDVVVSAVGFVAEHIETLSDLDVEARALAAALGLGFVRARCLDADPMFVDALAVLARRHLAQGRDSAVSVEATPARR